MIFPDFLLLFKRTVIPPENRLASIYKNIALKCGLFVIFITLTFQEVFKIKYTLL